MNQNHGKDDELIDALTAISVVSKRLARNLAIIAAHSQSQEREKPNELNEQDGLDHRKIVHTHARAGER